MTADRPLHVWIHAYPGFISGSVVGGHTQLRTDSSRLTSQRLSVQDGCIFWANCVVVPSLARDKVLADLHGVHPDVVKLNSWPACLFGG